MALAPSGIAGLFRALGRRVAKGTAG
jgi:hypothetical protein